MDGFELIPLCFSFCTLSYSVPPIYHLSSLNSFYLPLSSPFTDEIPSLSNAKNQHSSTARDWKSFEVQWLTSHLLPILFLDTELGDVNIYRLNIHVKHNFKQMTTCSEQEHSCFLKEFENSIDIYPVAGAVPIPSSQLNLFLSLESN